MTPDPSIHKLAEQGHLVGPVASPVRKYYVSGIDECIVFIAERVPENLEHPERIIELEDGFVAQLNLARDRLDWMYDYVYQKLKANGSEWP